jgi:alpha-tubulin suppressor-like RCC1 family protein
MVAGLQGVKIVQAALGGWHCLALDDAGQVHAWGGNEYAQCDELVSEAVGGWVLWHAPVSS